MTYQLKIRKTSDKNILNNPIFIKALDRVIRQIAARTGLMRRRLKEYIIRELSRKGRFYILDLSDTAITTKVFIHYLSRHTRQHLNFNKKFSSGYKRATTPDTRPFERIFALTVLSRAIKQSMK